MEGYTTDGAAHAPGHPSMNASNSCDRLWRKRLTELSSVWPDFVGGPAGRSAQGRGWPRAASARRCRSLACTRPQAKVKKLDRKMRELTRYLGPIRELDVELDMLDNESKDRTVPHRVIEIVRREVASRRQALRHELADKAPVGDVKKLIKKLERVGKRGEGRGKKGRERGQRASTTRNGVECWRSAWFGARSGSAPPSRQRDPFTCRSAFTACASRPRSCVTRSRSRRRSACPGAAVLVECLKRQQERLGHLHDLQVLLKHVREAEAAPGVGSRVNELTAYADTLERDCRRLHAGFVERRAELAECIKDVRQQLVPALTTCLRAVRSAWPVLRARRRAGVRGRNRAMESERFELYLIRHGVAAESGDGFSGRYQAAAHERGNSEAAQGRQGARRARRDVRRDSDQPAGARAPDGRDARFRRFAARRPSSTCRRLRRAARTTPSSTSCPASIAGTTWPSSGTSLASASWPRG